MIRIDFLKGLDRVEIWSLSRSLSDLQAKKKNRQFRNPTNCNTPPLQTKIMEWTRSISNRFRLSLQQFTHSRRRPNAFVERSISWLNSLWLYCRTQAVLSLTCLILFCSLVLMLLIYWHRRRALIVERKRSEHVSCTEQETATLRKQLKTTQTVQSSTQQSSTKGRVVDDYDGGAERAGQTNGPQYGPQYDQHRSHVKQRYVDQQANKQDQLVDQLGKQATVPYPLRDQRQTNQTHQNHQNHQNRPNHQNDQIKQFEKNESYLMNRGATNGADRSMNGGEPTAANYGTKSAAAERAKCQSDNKQQIEFNSRLKSLAKFDGHFCNKKFCCSDDEMNERRLNENVGQLAADGRANGFNRQRIAADDGFQQRTAAAVDGVRQRTTAQRSGAKQTNQLDAIRRTGQLNDQSSPQTRPPFQSETLEQSDCGCCCCPNVRLVRLPPVRAELSQQPPENTFCDCELCENRESENVGSRGGVGSTSSFGSCEPAYGCRTKCKIVTQIKENVSSRGSSSANGANDQINRQLFDNEYRRLVRHHRQRRTSEHHEDRRSSNEDAIQKKYDSWSSHLHITSPCK